MDSIIAKILKTNRVDGTFFTHVSLITPKGRFQFNRQVLESFWDVYCKYIQNCKNTISGIAEKPQQYLPVLVDVDLRMQDDGNFEEENLYSEAQLKSVIETYQSVLRQNVEKCTEQDLTCVLLEKDMRTEVKND